MTSVFYVASTAEDVIHRNRVILPVNFPDGGLPEESKGERGSQGVQDQHAIVRRTCCIFMYVRMYACIYVFICICIHMFMHMCMYSYVGAYVHTLFTFLYVCIYIYR